MNRRQFMQSMAAMLAAYTVPPDVTNAAGLVLRKEEGPRTVKELNAWFDRAFESIMAAPMAGVYVLDPTWNGKVDNAGPIPAGPVLWHTVWMIEAPPIRREDAEEAGPGGDDKLILGAIEGLVRITHREFSHVSKGRPKLYWRRRFEASVDHDFETDCLNVRLRGRMSSEAFTFGSREGVGPTVVPVVEAEAV